MNNTQIKYIKARLEEALHKKRGNLRIYGYDFETKERLFNEGRFHVEIKNNTFIIVFDGEKDFIESNKIKMDELYKEYTRILDQVMLGDNETAVELINNFIGE